jgi:WD40 repeat protein
MPDSASNPFVGLRPFESDESLLFFGRQEQTVELLERLNRNHFVAVTGSSGSGKSSILKAGLIPRLKAGYLVNDSDKWVICSMKPGQSPVCNLADAILAQLNDAKNFTATGIQEKINEKGVDAITDVLKLWNNDTNFFLLVDQFEELFRFSMDNADTTKKDEAIDFVNILLELSNQIDLSIYVVITMRSDFIGDCAQFYGLPEAMNQSQYIVPKLNRIQLETAIEGPVRLYNEKINPALTARLLNDAQTIKDELPLLQHALMRIWNYEKSKDVNGELSVEDYESIGGLEKALSNHADEALSGMSEQELILTKKIFQALTAIDVNGRKIRRPARLSELEAITGADRGKLLSIINRFIEDNRSFLIINKSENTNDLLIDISHESLIRQWGKLSAWVDEEAESGRMLIRLSESATLYKENKKDLLTGNELQQILQWYHSIKPVKAWALRYSTDFDNNIQYLQQSEQQQKKQHQKKIRNRRLLVSALIFIIIIIAGFAFITYKNYVSNKKELVLNYWRNGQSKRAENNVLDGLHLLAEAIAINNDKELRKTLLVDGQAYLPVTCLKNIFPQKDVIYNIVFSPDGKNILIAGNDGSARMIDKTTGGHISKDMQHQSPVNTAIFSKDGKLILTAGNDKTARIWYAVTGKQLHVFNHNDEVTSAVFSPDEKLILTASLNNVQTWDIATGKKLDSFLFDSPVKTAAFSHDGEKILIACNDIIPHIIQLSNKKEIHFFDSSGNDGSIIYNAVFSHDGKKIITINTNNVVDVWDSTGKKITSLKHDARITDAVFSPDDKWILTACDDKLARLWDVVSETQIGTAMKHEGPVYAVAFSPDGKQVITGGADKTIKLWDVGEMLKPKEIIFKSNGIVNSAVFNANGNKIAAAGYDSTVHIFDANGIQTNSFKHSSWIKAISFNSDGTKILITGNDSTIVISDVATGKELQALKTNSDVNSAAFNNDGNQIVIATKDLFVRTWNFTDKNPHLIDSFNYPADINSIAFTKNGKTLLIASDDSAAHILDAISGKLLESFNHDDAVESAVFSPDEKIVLTGSFDKTARVWDVTTAKQIGPSMKDIYEVIKAMFNANATWIITTSSNTVHLWNRNTLKEIGLPLKNYDLLTGAVFSPDSKSILISSHDSTARLLEIPGDFDIPPSLFKLQAQVTTGVKYNIETGETYGIPIEEWASLKKEYDKQGEEHYRNCKYPRYNLWHSFNNDKAVK